MSLEAQPTRHRPGSDAGWFVFVVGPSGAGKDTLLSGARSELAGDPRFHFVRRVITRPASASEDNDHMSEAEFANALAAGRFALTWEAHGLRYGVPESAREAVRYGRIVVCNGSRAAIRAAMSQFTFVKLVLVTAPEEVRRQRLVGRSREQDIGERIQRMTKEDLGISADLRIDNVGSIAHGVDTLVKYLRSIVSTVSIR